MAENQRQLDYRTSVAEHKGNTTEGNSTDIPNLFHPRDMTEAPMASRTESWKKTKESNKFKIFLFAQALNFSWS